jgi:hypothetical protein
LGFKWLLKLTPDGKNSGVAQCAALGLKLGAVKNNVEKNAITSLMSKSFRIFKELFYFSQYFIKHVLTQKCMLGLHNI